MCKDLDDTSRLAARSFHYNGISNEQRKKIISFAKSKVGKPYPFPGKGSLSINVPSLRQQKGYDPYYPWGETDKTPTDCYSCVGLVERAYEESGLNITPDGEGRDLVRESEALYTTWNEKEGSYVRYLTGKLWPYDKIDAWVFFAYTEWYKQDTKLTNTNPEDPIEKMRIVPATDELPTAQIIAPPNGEIISSKINPKYIFKATATDGINGSGIFKVEFYLDGTSDLSDRIGIVYTYKDAQNNPIFYYENDLVPIELPEYAYELDISNLSAGEHTIYAKATDRAGNKSTFIQNTFIINNSSLGQISKFNAEWINDDNGYSIKLTWINPNNSDLSGVMIYKNNTMDQGGEKIFDDLSQECIDTDVNNVQYTYYAYTYDKAGNINTNPVLIPFYPDNDKPVVTIISPAENSYPKEKKPTFSATITDVGTGVDAKSLAIHINSSVYYEKDGVGFTGDRLTFAPTYDLSEGGYVWKITGKDNAGNEINDTPAHKFTLDLGKPESNIYGY